MPRAKSPLEKLLAAASPNADPNMWPSTGYVINSAERRLLDQAPDMARTGQAVAKFLRQRVSEQSGHFYDCPAHEEIIHFQEAQPDSCCCAADLAALATWRKLGEAKEGRDG